MGKTPLFGADGLKKGAWTAEEDQKLRSYIEKHGEGGWRSLPEKAGLQRCGKSCRLRWTNYLRTGIKRGYFTREEDQAIIELHAALGNRWAAIARHLSKRTDNEVKNYWNAHLKKRLANMGIDPVAHKPVVNTPGASSSGNSNTNLVNIDPIIIDEENTIAQESEPTLQQPQSSRSTSASALLLNKLATSTRILRFPTLSFNRTTGDDIVCQPISSCKGSNTSIASPDTSDCWPDNAADPFTTPLNCLDLSNIVLSPESAEYGNASDEGGVSVATNIDYSLPDVLSILESCESEPPRSVSSSSSARVLNKMASQFGSLSCIDELHNWQHNDIPPGPIQGDHTDTTTTTAGAVVSTADLNNDDVFFDTVGSPVFYSPNYLENELEPSDLFDIP